MLLRRVDIRDVRILHRVVLEPASQFNVFVGPNGSGKTSLLEAIYLLGSGRSFRTRPIREVIARGKGELCVFGEMRGEDSLTETVGIEKGVAETRIRLSGQMVRASSMLARLLPLVLLTPDSQRLLSDGAELRRRLVDWALFHVEPDYHDLLVQYRRALRQRNAALREAPSARTLAPWTREVADLGSRLHGLREGYLGEVLGELEGTVEGLLGMRVAMAYEPGWNVREELAKVLTDAATEDRVRGFTGAGPHRADLCFTCDGSPAQHVLSRGEGKLFVVALMLGQLEYLARRSGRIPVALVDDLGSELDPDGRRRFLEALGTTGAQVFVTALSEDTVTIPEGTERALFHVEQGSVTKMV
jgi:DNA replication and repair protein RecF